MKRIFRKLKNLYRWFPVIWYDRDYDHAYIEHILYHKLVNTYNFFISDKAVTNWDEQHAAKSLKALHICILILERRLDNFYLKLCSDIYSFEETKKITGIETRDQKLLGYLLGEYLSQWWD